MADPHSTHAPHGARRALTGGRGRAAGGRALRRAAGAGAWLAHGAPVRAPGPGRHGARGEGRRGAGRAAAGPGVGRGRGRRPGRAGRGAAGRGAGRLACARGARRPGAASRHAVMRWSPAEHACVASTAASGGGLRDISTVGRQRASQPDKVQRCLQRRYCARTAAAGAPGRARSRRPLPLTHGHY